METQAGRCVARARLAAQGIDLPVFVQAARHEVSITADFQRPDKSLVAEICRHCYRENAPMPAWLKMRWLSLVRRARLEEIVRADRNLQRFPVVAIEVAE